MDLFDFIYIYTLSIMAISVVSFGCRIGFLLMNPERDNIPYPLRLLAPIGVLLSVSLLCCAHVQAIVLPQNTAGITAQEIREVPSVLYAALLFLCTAILSGTLGYNVQALRSDDAAVSGKAYSSLMIASILTASAIAFILILWAFAAKNIALGTGQVQQVTICFNLNAQLPVCILTCAAACWFGWLVKRKTAIDPAPEDWD